MAGAIDSSWQSSVSGSFIDPSRWSTNPVAPNNGTPNPGDSYRAFVTATGAPYDVTLNNSITLDALTLDSPDATFRHTGGVLQLAELNLKRGNWVLGDLAAGGTIKGATITGSNGTGILVPGAASSAMDGVTLAAPLTIQSSGGGSSRLRLYNGLTLSGATITMSVGGSPVQINADGFQSISGKGEIVFGSGVDFCQLAYSNHTGNLTIGSDIVIRSSLGSGIIGDPSSGMITNNGLISAETASRSITLHGNVVNHGTMRAIGGGTLSIPLGILTNTGTVILEQNSTLNLRGTVTEANLGNFQRNGGTVILNGIVPNVGASLSLDAFSGGWKLNGQVDGGSINAGANNHTLEMPAGNLTSGVTLNCDVNGGFVNVYNGLTLNGIMTLGPGGSLNFTSGSQLFDGTGVVRFDGPEYSPNTLTSTSGGVLNIGSGITIMSGSYGATVGMNKLAITNAGLISSRTSGKTIVVTGTSVTNTGTFEARDGGVLKVTNLIGSAGNLSLSNGGQLDLDGAYTLVGNTNVPTGTSLTLRGIWNNIGNISGGGSFVLVTPPSSGTLPVSGGTIAITGAVSTSVIRNLSPVSALLSIRAGGLVNNTSDTIHIDAPWTGLELAGGSINGGSIDGTPSATFRATSGTSTLNGVNLAVPISVENGAELVLSGAWNATAPIELQSAKLTLSGTFPGQRLSLIGGSNATVNIIGTVDNANATLALPPAVGTLQLGAGASVTSGRIGNIGSGTVRVTGAITLDATMLAGSISGDSGLITIKNGLNLDQASIALRAPSTGITAVPAAPGNPPATIGGAGEIIFQAASGASILSATGTALQIGPGIVIRTGTNNLGTISSFSGGSVINQGVISSRGKGAISISAGSFENQGTIEVRDQSSVTLPATFNNLQGGVLTGGNWAVYDSGSIIMSQSVSANAANISLSGALSSFPAINALSNNSGNLTITGGRGYTSSLPVNNLGLITVGSGGSLGGMFTGNAAGTIRVDAGALFTPKYVRDNAVSVGGVMRLVTKSSGGATSRLSKLVLDGDPNNWTGKLDLSDNALIVDYTTANSSPLPTLRSQITQAFGATAATHWTGNGITSSRATAAANTALGYGEASAVLALSGTQTASWQGQTVDATSVLVRYTLSGDTNLDGAVDFKDLVKIAQNYNDTSGNRLWSEGDFNYDGNVNFSDLVAVAQNYNAAPLPSLPLDFQDDFQATLALVPEPASLAPFTVAIPSLLRRGRYRRPSRAT
jgi:hypothetical protein